MNDDLISRKAALVIIQSLYPGMPRTPLLLKDWQKRYEPYINAEKAISALPSAHPGRKKGKWIWMGDKGDSRFMCSVCKGKENVPTIMGKPTVWDYCPNCGAQMDERGEDE